MKSLWGKAIIMLSLLCLIICIQVSYATPFEHFHNDNKLACIYAYYEKNEDYKNNLGYFVAKGILPHVDYYFVVNGDTCSVDIPKAKNIKVIQRDNSGFDFGAWGEIVNNHDMSGYDHVFFLNTSVRGPFYKGKDWTKPFLALFTKNVKLVGTSINICRDLCYDSHHALRPMGTEITRKKILPHVQSMFFVLDKDALKFLLSRDFFKEDKEASFAEIISQKEIGLSSLIISKGWNINSILPKYRDIDYRVLRADINASSLDGDPYFAGAYFGDTIDPYDVIFFKSWRIPEVII